MWRWIGYPVAAFALGEGVALGAMLLARGLLHVVPVNFETYGWVFSVVGIVFSLYGAICASEAVEHFKGKDAIERRLEEAKITYDREQREKMEKAIGMLAPDQANEVISVGKKVRP